MSALRSLYIRCSLWGLFAVALLLHQFPTANKFDWINHLKPFVVAVLLCGMVAMFGFFFWQKKQALSKGPALFLVAFLAWFALAFVFADVRSFAFPELFILLGLIPLFLFFAGEEEFEKTLPTAMTVFLLVQALWGVDTFLSTSHQRFFGLFYDPALAPNAWPNAYALFVLASFPWMLYRFFLRGKRAMWLKCVLVGFVLGGFFMTLSRAGFLAFGLELFFLGLFLYRDKSFAKPSWVRFAAGLLVVLMVGAASSALLQSLKDRQGEVTNLVDRFTFTDTQGSVSVSERLEFFEGSLQLIQREPIFGLGAMSFRSVYPQVQQSFLAISDHSHNLLLKWGMENGVPVVLFFLGFLLLLFLKCNPFSARTPLFQRVAWATLLGVLAHSMVDYNFNFFSNALLFWMLLAAVSPGQQMKTGWLWIQRFFVFIVVLSAVFFAALLNAQENRFQAALKGGLAPEDVQHFDLLLPRWELLQLADRYEKDPELRELLLKKHLETNPYDAEAYYRLGLLDEIQNQADSALEHYKTAVTLKPKGTFLYFLAYLRLAEKQGRDDVLEELRPTLEANIEEYLPMYEMNLHYTQAYGEIERVRALQELLEL